MSILIAGILLIAGLALPAWLAALAILTVMATGVALGADVLFSAGSVDVRAHDPLVLALLLRWLTRVFLAPARVFSRPALGALAFLLLLLPGLVGAASMFGASAGLARLPSFARLVTEVLLVAALAFENTSARDFERLRVGLWLLALVVGGSIVLGRLLLNVGIVLGEVQVSAAGTARSFGVAGDQAAFFLTFFVFLALMRKQYLLALGVVSAILLTGGLGALVVLGVGATLIGMRALRAGARGEVRPVHAGRVVAGLGVAAILLGLVAPFAWRVVSTRLADGLIFTQGSGIQRLLVLRTATDIVVAHPVVGVGYGGFLDAALQGGAAERFTQEMQIAAVSQTFFQNANNQTLQTLADGGVLGLVGLAVMLLTFGVGFRRGARLPEPMKSVYATALIWMLAMALGNQSAVWILPGSLLGGFLFVLAGFAGAMTTARE